jgi:hypothetical protein
VNANLLHLSKWLIIDGLSSCPHFDVNVGAAKGNRPARATLRASLSSLD